MAASPASSTSVATSGSLDLFMGSCPRDIHANITSARRARVPIFYSPRSTRMSFRSFNRRQTLFATFMALFLLPVHAQEQKKELLVFAAASLTNVLGELSTAW